MTSERPSIAVVTKRDIAVGHSSYRFFASPERKKRKASVRSAGLWYRLCFVANFDPTYFANMISTSPSILASVVAAAVSLLAGSSFATVSAGKLRVAPAQHGFSAIKGTESRVGTVSMVNDQAEPTTWSASVSGEHAAWFLLHSKASGRIDPGKSAELQFVFAPPSDFVGIATATLRVDTGDESSVDVVLRGLSTKGLEGKNEAPLADVLATLGLGTDLGWETLAHHVKPELQGDEIAPSLFTKAGEGHVDIVPLARYSPSFRLPFGFYTSDGRLHQVGVLSAQKKPVPEHQTLHPQLEEGSTEFDPGNQSWGIYTSSPTHDAFSQDSKNRTLNQTSSKRHAVHACRTYPVRTADGKLLENQFLFCFEEAFNGDYQDYVFLVKNVKPVTK